MIERAQRVALAVAGLLALGSPAAVSAGVVNLWGIADGDSAYYEYPSDAFFRMDLYDPPPRETQQRFHLISDPSVTVGSEEFDGFPNDEDFRLGSVTYDESMLVGGTGTATITAMSLGIGADPNNASYINYGRWADIGTTVDSFTGTVDVVDGQPMAIDLDSDVTVTAYGGLIVATGPFTIVGDQFTGLIATPAGPGQVVWDFSGQLTTVPEPTSLVLSSLGAVALILRRRPS